MPPRPLPALLALLALLVAVAATVGPVAATPGAGEFGADAGRAPVATPTEPSQEPGETVIEIQLEPDGDATITVSTAVAVRTESEAAAFEDLAAEFERGERTLGFSAFQRASEEASAHAGREMNLRDVNRSSFVRDDVGYLVLRFTWTNFSRESGSTLAVGDAFRTESGTWLTGLGANQSLVIRPPAGYGVTNSSIGPINGVLRWEGPVTFEPGDLSAAYLQGEDTPTTTPVTTSPPTTAPTTTVPTAAPTTTVPTTTPPAGSGSFFWGGVVVFGVGVVAVVAYMLTRDEGVGVTAPTADDADASGAESDGGSAGGTAPPAGTDAGTDAADEDGESETEPEDAGIAEELLSDEERVERLLERNGGRMKQADIVSETGWSNAKVSQLLSSMEEEGRIDKLRIGRENLISFPDEDIGEFE